MRQVKRLLPYVRRYVQMAVYDVLDAEGAEYWKNESGAVVARLSVYGNVSTFSLSTEIQDVGTGLTVSMREPCPGLSAQGEERAVTAGEAVVDGIRSLARQAAELVVVTNEVGLDGISYEVETMEYIRLMGRVNQRLAKLADRVVEVVYGIPVVLKENGAAGQGGGI